MVSYRIEDVRSFMNHLLRQSTFDAWEVREVKLHTMIRYQIMGDLNQAFFTEAEQADLDRSYCLWSDLKNTIFSLIKGTKQPTLMQITLAMPKGQITEVPTEAVESFLLNIHYEDNTLTLITAVSMKSFTLDRSAEQYWDKFIGQFLETHEIVSTLS